MAERTTIMGLGGGFLTNEFFNTMKKAQEETIIEPITKKMQKNLDKQTSLTEIMTLMETLKTNVKKFNDSDTYLKRKSTVTGDGVTATIGTATALQDITIQVHQLAKNDLTQLGRRFESRDSIFSNTNTSLKFNHNGRDYSIDIKAGQSVGDVAQAITDATDGAVMGIMMKTGGNQPYQLMIQSKETGENNRVYFGTTTTSSTVKGGAISGDFNVTVKDANGVDKTVAVNLNTPSSNTTQDNVNDIIKSITTALEADPDLKSLLDNGDLNIGAVRDGKGFVINDKRGSNFSITDGTLQVSDIGLKAGDVSVGTDHFTASATLQGGAFTGKIRVGDVDVDLSTVTAAGNTAQQNLQAIITQINTSTQVQAKEVNGKLVVNNIGGGDSVQIILDPSNSSAQNTEIASKLGITGGFHTSYAEFAKSGLTTIQKAQDARFSWNGIEISRPKNTVDDVVTGISVELTKEHKGTDTSVVRITRDDDDIFKGIDEFVKAYNELISKVEEETRYDEKTKVKGNLNGESAITSIRSQLKNILNFSAGSKNTSISTYGFSFDDDGKLKIDEKKLKEAYKNDPDMALAFFKGGEFTVGGIELPKRDSNGNVIQGEYERIGGTKTQIDGLFSQFAKAIDGLITGSKSTLKTYEQSLKDEYRRNEDDKKEQQERLDSRMEGIRERMNAFDALIMKYQDQANKLQQMMNASSK